MMLFLALVTAMTAIVIGYPLATRPLTRAGDKSIVERASRDARTTYLDVDAHRRSTFPIVLRLVDRTCVELRSWAADGAGSYTVCYDARSGKKMAEQTNAGF
jgi:hypothetical protein